MALRIARFFSLLLTALATGVALCHVLELPNKLALPAVAWWGLQRVLYNGFGRILGPVEWAALFSTLLVLFLVRRRPAAFALTLVSVLCIAAELVVWVSFVGPANVRVDASPSVPADWIQVRDQWEYGHAARALLLLIGLSTLNLSVLVDTRSMSAHSSS